MAPPARSLAFATCAAGILASATAAASPSARLVYARGPGAESCPDEAALRKAVAARVGYDPFFPWAPVTMTVEVTGAPGHLRARVIYVDEGAIEKGAQTLESAGATCDDLVGSIALTVSVALDAMPPPAPPEPEPSAPLPAAPAPAPVVAPPTAAPVEKRDARLATTPPRGKPMPAVGLWVAPGGRASAGMWPAAAVGLEVLVELRRGWLGLGVVGRYELPATIGVGGTSQASIDKLTGSLAPCAHFGWLVTCGLATFGGTRAQGLNVDGPRTLNAPYAAFGGRVGVDVTILPKLHALGTVDVVGIATRTVVAVDGASGAAASRAQNGPVEASGGIALLVPIF